MTLPNSPNLYVGIDQSIVCTSVAVLVDGTLTTHRIKKDVRGPELLCEIFDDVKCYVKQYTFKGTPHIAIEGYAYGAKGAYFNLGEVGGVIRLAAFQEEWPLIQVPPTTLKKYITGKGTSPKDIMIKEMYKKYGLDINDNNDADAAGLAILAHEYYETQLHIVKAYMHDLHKTCELIVGEHPNKMTHKEFLKDMPDNYKISDWEKERKKKK